MDSLLWGCYPEHMKLIDISGQRFGRLVVVAKAPEARMWRCLCDCGHEKSVTGPNLRSGSTSSCGCRATEWSKHLGSNPAYVAKRAARQRTHGHKGRSAASPEYKTWLRMKRRCYDPKCKDFPNWGGRGIVVCDAWRFNFSAFLRDMGLKPFFNAQIDRMNPEGAYEASNCRWVTPHVQASENRRTFVEVVVAGVHYPNLRAACAAHDAGYTMVHQRIRLGLDPETAILTPKGQMPNNRDRTSYLRKAAR